MLNAENLRSLIRAGPVSPLMLCSIRGLTSPARQNTTLRCNSDEDQYLPCVVYPRTTVRGHRRMTSGCHFPFGATSGRSSQPVGSANPSLRMMSLFNVSGLIDFFT